MTGFGKSLREAAGRRIEVEVRSVNNRFLKLQLRTNRALQPFESRIESWIKESVERGTVSMTVRSDALEAPATLTLNDAELRRLHRQSQELADELGVSAPTSIEAYFAIAGVVGQPETTDEFDADAMTALEEAVREAMENLVTMRRREGEKLRGELESLARTIESEVAKVAARAPEVVSEQRDKLQKRVDKIMEDLKSQAGIGEDALLREIAILADRSDIAEELQRLGSHLEQFHELLGEEPVGRKLDFLLQEMLREANTIASKASDAPIARSVVVVKSELEKIREQVQNVE